MASEEKAKLLHSLRLDSAPPPTLSPAPSSRRRLLPAAIGIVLLAGVAWYALSPSAAPDTTKTAATGASSAAPSPALVSTIAPGGLIASGYLVARRKATVAAEIGGKVLEVPVEEGMVVQAGQLLARLDSVLADADALTSQSRVRSAEAALVSLQADLLDADKSLERTRNLQRGQFASEADLSRNQARASSLRGQLRKAEADLETARRIAERDRAFADKYQIRAPFTGIVIERNAQPGEIISPSSAGGGFTRTGICTIVDMDSIEIEVDVNEAFIARVSPGQQAEAVLDAYPDWKIPASVIAIIPTANREKATVKVRLKLLQKDPRALPDMAVKVTFREVSASKSTGGANAAEPTRTGSKP